MVQVLGYVLSRRIVKSSRWGFPRGLFSFSFGFHPVVTHSSLRGSLTQYLYK
jgi:hypothetical protein